MASEMLSYSAAVMLGLMGSTHCLFMCGGIMAALGVNAAGVTMARRFAILCGYNLGRIGSYLLAGVMAALLGLWLRELHATVGLVLRLLSGLLLVLMGCYIAGWWRILTRLEQAGEGVWRHLQPMGRRLLPVNSFGKALLSGMLWGWLPCGLVYSVLAWAATAGSVAEAGLLMVCFGLGTLPAMLLTGLLARKAQQLVSQPRVRNLSGLLVILFGLWTIAGTVIPAMGSHAGHQLPGQPQPAIQQPAEPAGHHHH